MCDAVGNIVDIYLAKIRVGQDRCLLLILYETLHDIAENIGSVAAISIASTTGIGEESSMRRCTCMRTEMAGRLKSAWLAYFGDTAL